MEQSLAPACALKILQHIFRGLVTVIAIFRHRLGDDRGDLGGNRFVVGAWIGRRLGHDLVGNDVAGLADKWFDANQQRVKGCAE